MKSRLIRIGNSRGVRLPKPLIEEAGLEGEVDVQVREGALVISSRSAPRAGWAEAARRMRERVDDRLLGEPSSTRFEDEEGRWPSDRSVEETGSWPTLTRPEGARFARQGPA